MKVQWKSGRPKRRWLDRLRDDIKDKGLPADELYDRATWRRTPTRHKWVIPYEINQEKAKMFLTPSDFDKIWHTYWDYYEFQIYQILDL